MDYATISLEKAHDNLLYSMSYGYGRDRVQMFAGYETFARIARTVGIREFHILATDTIPDRGICMSVKQGMDMYLDIESCLLIDSLTADNKMKRGRKITYAVKLIDPYTCAVLAEYKIIV